MSGLTVVGQLVEMGQLEGENGADGVVICREDGSHITIKGLTQAEVACLECDFYGIVCLSVDAEVAA